MNRNKPEDERNDAVKFDNAPIFETALGVEFAPITGWTPSHFSLYGRAIEGEYSRPEIQSSIVASGIERFGPDAYRPQFPTFDFGDPAMRWWYVDDKNGRLVQLQRDKFVHNWRKSSPTTRYPGYEVTREMFRSAWTRFLGFLGEQGLHSPEVVQCQVDYVNHIEQGQGWRTLADLPRVTPFLATPHTSFLPVPEVVLLNTRYVIPPERGRLHITIQPAIRNADQVEILQLQIVVRGRPDSSKTEDIIRWLDMGHEWALNGFVEATTPEMHTIWGRR